MEQEFILDKLFLNEGISSYMGIQPVTYDKVIVMAYDGNPKRLRIIEDLQLENLVDFSVPHYKPYQHIINIPTSRAHFRWLVGAKADREE